jgi:hypothetical protein
LLGSPLPPQLQLSSHAVMLLLHLPQLGLAAASFAVPVLHLCSQLVVHGSCLMQLVLRQLQVLL